VTVTDSNGKVSYDKEQTLKVECNKFVDRDRVPITQENRLTAESGFKTGAEDSCKNQGFTGVELEKGVHNIKVSIFGNNLQAKYRSFEIAGALINDQYLLFLTITKYIAVLFAICIALYSLRNIIVVNGKASFEHRWILILSVLLIFYNDPFCFATYMMPSIAM